jgi:F-type H+-transporting ATPase subunit a
MASPLDQFGEDDDDDFMELVESTFLSGFPGSVYIDGFLDLTGLSELDEDFAASFLSQSYGFLVDYEDVESSEWSESDHAISSIQSSIFISNILGMLPGAETTTSDVTATFMFSLSTMASIILIGFALHNVRFLSVLYPTGTPVVMAPFIILIEFVSFLARAVSLGMRLFANLFAGHSLVKILVSFAWSFLNPPVAFFSIPVFALILIIFFLEVGIAYLQSYVFGALAGMYFEDAINLGH